MHFSTTLLPRVDCATTAAATVPGGTDLKLHDDPPGKTRVANEGPGCSSARTSLMCMRTIRRTMFLSIAPVTNALAWRTRGTRIPRPPKPAFEPSTVARATASARGLTDEPDVAQTDRALADATASAPDTDDPQPTDVDQGAQRDRPAVHPPRGRSPIPFRTRSRPSPARRRRPRRPRCPSDRPQTSSSSLPVANAEPWGLAMKCPDSCASWPRMPELRAGEPIVPSSPAMSLTRALPVREELLRRGQRSPGRPGATTQSLDATRTDGEDVRERRPGRSRSAGTPPRFPAPRATCVGSASR